MAYKLKNGEFKISCRHDGCPFDFKVKIKQNIMGMTEEDVEEEAKKLALDVGRIKHDAIYGTKHKLTNPAIKKVSGVYEAIGQKKRSIQYQSEAVKYKDFKKGDNILNKGDIAKTICEVIKGGAQVDKNKTHLYKPGESFGASALLINQARRADVIASEDHTTIAFYNLKELSKKDPKKAKELYTEAMEDIFDVIDKLEGMVDSLEDQLEKSTLICENRKERIKNLEEDLLNVSQKLQEMGN
ncbi:MAG: cyclic nucleotide-binding domain-containing protein [Spirochaetes bacterium]|nr:cyclic nucleotide-binding domain-containing protein [Spirochaetota bacterium]